MVTIVGIEANEVLPQESVTFTVMIQFPAPVGVKEVLAEKALLLFKSIETGGGFLKQLKENMIQQKLQDSAEKGQARFDAGQEILVGTNRYQNENDKMKDSIELYPFLKKNARKTLIQPILERRLAEEVEQKRLDDE